LTWLIVSFFVETFIATKVLSGQSRIHPLVMLLGIIGGTTLFGLFGFIIGPLILVYTIRLVKELVSSR
jgi:predicted PurR-regulated permease PerM